MCPCAQWYLTFSKPHGLYSARLLCAWNSVGKNTGMGSYSFLLTQSALCPLQHPTPCLLPLETRWKFWLEGKVWGETPIKWACLFQHTVESGHKVWSLMNPPFICSFMNALWLRWLLLTNVQAFLYSNKYFVSKQYVIHTHCWIQCSLKILGSLIQMRMIQSGWWGTSP